MVAEGSRPGLFPSTRWSRVLAAQNDPALHREVIEELVRPRWKALYVLARQQLNGADAEDAVQSFLTRLLSSPPEAAFLRRLDPDRGSLRAYLKTAFRHHLVNLHASHSAQKRGGGIQREDLCEIEQQISGSSRTPEQLFDRAWAASMFSETLGDLRAEFASGARRGPFEIVERLLSFGAMESYETLARHHEMSTAQLKSFVHRAKQRFRALLRDRVTRTLGEGEDVDLEIRKMLEDLADE